MALLSDGPANSAWWEHRTIADRLGLPLVGIADLEVRGDGLYATIDGRPRRLDVVYRRTGQDRLRGPDGRPTYVGRMLEEPWLRGQVAPVNAFGAGVADDKLAHLYVPDMIRFYLGQEPLLPSVPTYDLAVPEALEDVRSRIDELVVKPREGSGGTASSSGRMPTRPTPPRLPRPSAAGPRARRPGARSALARPDARRRAARPPPRRPARLRLPGRRAGHGAARRAHARRLEEGALVVNSSQNGGAKDTWVLG